MSFTHASAPRPVAVSVDGRTGIKVVESRGVGGRASAASKPRYRDSLLEQAAAALTFVRPNIMCDPRVLRGPTAGQTLKLADTVKLDQTMQRTGTLPQHAAAAAASPSPSPSAAAAAAARSTKAALLRSGAIRPSHPSVAYIHNHIVVVKKRVEVPTHLYLVEQKEATLVHNTDSQTDALMPEPPTPDYVPRKTGVDTATQVDTDMVFRFDEDVAAILEVVVSKTTEQALMEVREEEELRAIEDHRRELHDKFNDEEAAADERLRQERALFEAKEKMLAEARARQAHIVRIRAKLAAAHFSRAYLKDLSTHGLEELSIAGFFNAHDSVSHQLEASYLPTLTSKVELALARTEGARTLLDGLLLEGLEQSQAATRTLLAARAAEQARLDAEAEAAAAVAAELARRQRRIQLFIHSDAVPAEQSPVGPINLTGESTVADIESQVYRWMEENLSDEDGGPGVPARDRLRFLWNGVELDRSATTAVYDIGIASLATLTMELARLPTPPPVEKKEGDSDDEGEDDEEDHEEEEEDEDDV